MKKVESKKTIPKKAAVKKSTPKKTEPKSANPKEIALIHLELIAINKKDAKLKGRFIGNVSDFETMLVEAMEQDKNFKEAIFKIGFFLATMSPLLDLMKKNK